MIAAHRHQNSFDYLKITLDMDSYKYIDLILDVLKVNTSLSLTVVSSLKKIDKAFKKTSSKNKH